MSDDRPQIGDYYICSTIGLGSTAKVKIGKHKETGEKVAIKIIKKKLFAQQPDLATKLQREISVMKILNHPNLLKFLNFYESEKYVYLVLELGSRGELFDLISDQGALPLNFAMTFFRQIVYGLDFLHSHNICHRDIKPENILLDENYNVKIADFGFARFLKSSAAETSCGSPHYAAPEVIKAQPYDGKAADIWSLGVLFYTMLTGTRPFEDRAVKNLLQKIKNAEYEMPKVQEEIQDMLRRMLTVEPSQRITIQELKKHPGFRILLPETYVVPHPLPAPEVPGPLEVEKIKPETLELLGQVDTKSAEEINAALTADHPTLEKAFYILLSKIVCFDMLPWGELKPGPVEADVHTMKSTPEFSLEQPPEVAPLQTSLLEGIKVSLPKTDNAIQQVLTKAGYTYFFPDEQCFYARNGEKSIDIIINIEYKDEGSYNITFQQLKGDKDQFNQLVADITTDVKAIVEPPRYY